MKCIYCSKSITEINLHRTNPLGQSDAGWACMPCIEQKHPELATNIKEDVGPLMNDINDALGNPDSKY